MSRNFEDHPCFNARGRHQYGRVHLPVAASCNIQCRYCNRKYDCVSESRPGVSSVVLAPSQALAYLREALAHAPCTSVVGIAGPGDPLANASATLETLALVRAAYPEMLLCLATNGLKLPEFAAELVRLRVSHVTVTINAVDPAIGDKIYAWVRDGKRVLRREEGAALLIERQMAGVAKLKEYGTTVKVNTVVVPGINDEHVVDVAQKVAGLGADIMNCVPIYPVKGSEWEATPAPLPAMINRIRQAAGKFLPQMSHCSRCRADAAGLIGDTTSKNTIEMLKRFAGKLAVPTEARPYVAVATVEGVLVNQHLGEATHLWVFAQEDGRYQPVEVRATPEPGGARSRWENLALTFRDCRALLVNSAGESPKCVLTEHGLQVIEMEGLVDTALRAIYGGGDVSFLLRKTKTRCGTDCAGNGRGCG